MINCRRNYSTADFKWTLTNASRSYKNQYRSITFKLRRIFARTCAKLVPEKFSKPQKQFLSTRLEVTRGQTRARAKRAFRAKIFRSEASSNFCQKIANYYYFRVRSEAHSFLLSCFLTGFEPSTSWACYLSLSFVLKLKKSFLLTSTFLWKSLKITFLTFFLQKLNKPFLPKAIFGPKRIERKGMKYF